MESVTAVETILGYRFRDPTLLEIALTHRSIPRESGDANNQRLEFLGDAVLGLIIAGLLYARYPLEAEGDLSKRLVSLVNGELLTAIAQTMELGDHLILAEGEEEQGGRANPSNLEDACEAILGAIYLDGGLEAAQAFVLRFWDGHLTRMTSPPKDPKTTLQEWAQARGLPLPEYRVVSADGPSHAPHFIIEVVSQSHAASGEAGTKRLAERYAATALLAKLGV